MSKNLVIEAFTNEQLKTEVASFNVGDTIRVHNRIKEGNRERIQLFEGTVIAKRNGGISETFTVRRVAYGCGVEKTFPLHSPNVARSTLSDAVRLDVLSSSISVTELVRQLRLRKISESLPVVGSRRINGGMNGL